MRRHRAGGEAQRGMAASVSREGTTDCRPTPTSHSLAPHEVRARDGSGGATTNDGGTMDVTLDLSRLSRRNPEGMVRRGGLWSEPEGLWRCKRCLSVLPADGARCEAPHAVELLWIVVPVQVVPDDLPPEDEWALLAGIVSLWPKASTTDTVVGFTAGFPVACGQRIGRETTPLDRAGRKAKRSLQRAKVKAMAHHRAVPVWMQDEVRRAWPSMRRSEDIELWLAVLRDTIRHHRETCPVLVRPPAGRGASVLDKARWLAPTKSERMKSDTLLRAGITPPAPKPKAPAPEFSAKAHGDAWAARVAARKALAARRG